MTLYLETEIDTFIRWSGERIDGILYPLQIENLWSDESLSELNLYKPIAADATPEGKRVVSTEVQRVGGVVKYVNTLEDYVSPIPNTPTIYAVGNFQVSDYDITGIETSINFAAAIWMDIGNYLVLFSDHQDNTNYLAKAYSGTGQALAVEKANDYVIINANNSLDLFDPAEFSLEIIKVI